MRFLRRGCFFIGALYALVTRLTVQPCVLTPSLTQQGNTYTLTLPAGATSVTFDASCPVSGNDARASSNGLASGGRLTLEPQGDATLTGALLYSPLLTPTTATCKCVICCCTLLQATATSHACLANSV